MRRQRICLGLEVLYTMRYSQQCCIAIHRTREIAWCEAIFQLVKMHIDMAQSRICPNIGGFHLIHVGRIVVGLSTKESKCGIL